MKSFSLLSLSTIFFSVISALPSSESSNEAGLQSYTSSSTPSLPFGKSAISAYDLATSFPPAVIQDASSIEAIRNTLALYAFAIDGKNFAALTEVFTTNVVANYSAPLGVLTPLESVISVLSQRLACVTTQHSYGTQLIQIHSLTTAFSVTYFRAAHFGKEGALANDIATAYAQYQDTWQRQSNGRWKIVQRNLEYMGPLIGNLAVFTAC